MAEKAFTNARVLTAASSGTALNVDQTSGLTTSDTLILVDASDMSTHEELTVSTVTDENNLVVSTISESLAVNDIVLIKAQAPTYDLSNELIWSGGAQAFAANGANGIQNLSSEVNIEEMSLTFTNELEPRWAAKGVDVVDRFPTTILLKGFSVEGQITKYHQDVEFLDMLRSQEQLTLRFEWLGNALSSNSAAAASATIESDGAGTITVGVDASGEAGNDYAVIVQAGTSASPTAALSGKLITVSLGTTPSNNTVTAVASAIDALSGVSASDTGTDLITTTDNPEKIFFAGGRDANEVEKLRIDLPDVRVRPFNANISSDDVMQEEINFTAFRDVNDDREVLVRLRNDISDY